MHSSNLHKRISAYARSATPKAYARKDILLLKLIVQHSPKLLAFVCGLQLRLSTPQWQHVIRLADALMVAEARHKTIAGVYRLIVDAPDSSNGADTLRISPWTAEDLRTPICDFIVQDLVEYAHESDNWPLYVSLDDSLDDKDQGDTASRSRRLPS